MDKSFRAAALVVLGFSQIMLLTTMSHRSYSYYPYVAKPHPASKEFSQEVHQMDKYTVIDYNESLTKAGTDFLSCGHIYQQKWFPKLYDNKENYTAFLRDGLIASRQFDSIKEAEQWLFSQGCPDSHWGHR